MPAILAIMRAIRGSDLPPTDRHILMTLVSLADPESGIIPERFMPSFTDLSRHTGLGRSTIGRRLPFIEDAGWIKRTAPSLSAAWKDKEKNSYTLLIPTQRSSEDDDSADEEGAPTSPRAGLVPEGDQSEGQSQSGTSPRAGLGLVPEGDRTSPTVGLEVPGLRTITNQPPPSEGDAHSGDTEPEALFSMPGPRKPPVVGSAAEKTAPKKGRPAKRKRLSRVITKHPETMPVEWQVSDEMAAWAKENTPKVVQRLATARFLTHFADSGKRAKDWDRAWRNWLLRDQQYIEERGSNGGGYSGRGSPGRNANSNPGNYRNPEDDSVYDEEWEELKR